MNKWTDVKNNRLAKGRPEEIETGRETAAAEFTGEPKNYTLIQTNETSDENAELVLKRMRLFNESL